MSKSNTPPVQLGRAAGLPPSGEAPHIPDLEKPVLWAERPGRGGDAVMADLGAIPRNVLSEGEERQTHAAPPPGNGGRVPRSGSASGSALTTGTTVRTRRSIPGDYPGEWIEAGEVGWVIGWEGSLAIVSFSEGRTATCETRDLR